MKIIISIEGDDAIAIETHDSEVDLPVSGKAALEPVAGIIDDLGGNAVLTEALGLSGSAVSEMRRRGSIPAKHWGAILRFAAKAGVSTVTADRLVQAHDEQRDLVSEPTNWPLVVCEILAHRGWKTVDLARHVGTSGPNVSRWRLGTITPSAAVQKVLRSLHESIPVGAAA